MDELKLKKLLAELDEPLASQQASPDSWSHRTGWKHSGNDTHRRTKL
jgi:hypothetical protein